MKWHAANNHHAEKHKTALHDETEELVKFFYCRDDISRCVPGKRDFIIVRDEAGKKDKIQKRNLPMTVKEAYSLSANPSVDIGKSKFAALRLQQVKLVSDSSQNVCLCRHHENVNLLLSACNAAGSDIPKYTTDFVRVVACNAEMDVC